MNSGKSPDLKKQISYLLISIGTLAFCFNFFGGLFIKGYSFLFLVSHPSVNTIFIATIIIVVSMKFFPGIVGMIHITILLLISFMGILSDYNNFYGIGQIILAMLLMYKYGFLEKRVKVKLFLVALFYVGSIELSIFLSNRPEKGVGIEVLMYTVFFIYFLYILYHDEVNELIMKDRISKDDIRTLRIQQKHLNSKLIKLQVEKKAIDEQIKYSLSVDKNVDLNQFGLTKTEIKIVMILINKKKKNSEIADEMHVSESTIKTHLYNIYGKVGVKTRGELIGMFNHIEIS